MFLQLCGYKSERLLCICVSRSCIFERLWNMQLLTSDDSSLIRARRHNVLLIHCNSRAVKPHHSRFTRIGPRAKKRIWCFDKLGARGSPHSIVSRWELRNTRRCVIWDGRQSYTSRPVYWSDSTWSTCSNREIRNLALDERQEGMLIESVPLTLNIHWPQMSAPQFPMQERGFWVLRAR